jgi:hypothetical protein
MTHESTARGFSYARLVAPVALILFAIGWYEYSVVYIQGADNQLVASGNLAVYVPVQQISGYLASLLDATYLVVAVGVVVLVYNAVKLVRFKTAGAAPS